MYKFIIFDVDGTLIETEEAVVNSYQRVIQEEFGRKFSLHEIFENHSVPTYERMKRFGVSDVDKAVSKFHKYLMESFCDLKPYDGITGLLAELGKRSIVTGIVTARSKIEVNDDPCLQSFISDFKNVISADDTLRHKPDAEPLLKIIKDIGADKRNTLYVGDTVSDYLCARNAGVDFGLAMWGAKKIDGIAAAHVLNKPQDVLKLI